MTRYIEVVGGPYPDGHKLHSVVRRFSRLEFTGQGRIWIWDMNADLTDPTSRFDNHYRPLNWEIAT